MLLIVVLSIIGLTGYLLATNNITDQERDEMLKDEEMWP